MLLHAGNVVPIVMFTAELAVLSEEGGQVKGEFDETDEWDEGTKVDAGEDKAGEEGEEDKDGEEEMEDGGDESKVWEEEEEEEVAKGSLGENWRTRNRQRRILFVFMAKHQDFLLAVLHGQETNFRGEKWN